MVTQLSCLRTDGQQRLYIFQGSHFWEVSADGNVSEPRPLQEKWAGLPPHIEAAAVSLDSGDFYFFKGTSLGADEKIEAWRREVFSPRSKEGWGPDSTLNLWPQGTLPGGSFSDGLLGMGVEVVPERGWEGRRGGEQRTTPELCNPTEKSCFL